MSTPHNNSGAPTFERIQEYQIVLENIAQVSARRQNLNSVFVAINTVFLTALGVLLYSSRLASWWDMGTVGAIALVVTPLNLTWRMALSRYKRGLTIQYEYVREIEAEFRRRRGTTDEPPIGLYLKIDKDRRPHSGNTRLEMRIANYFIWLYPFIALAVAALIYLTANHTIPPFSPN